jgi:hypothetical protein
MSIDEKPRGSAGQLLLSGTTIHYPEPLLKQHQHGRARLLLAGLVTFAIVALAVAAVLLSAGPGEQENATNGPTWVGTCTRCP